MAAFARSCVSGAVAVLAMVLEPGVIRADTTVVTAAGVTLHSTSVEFPGSDRSFPEGAGAEVVTNNCTACHSPGMVLTQPPLPQAVWQAEVYKMRGVYKAPVAAEDVPAIVAYLTQINRAK